VKTLIFGATGMVGRGVLRECLLDSQISKVLVIGRTSVAINDPKLQEILQADFWNSSQIEDQLKGYDACFFCLGTPSAGKSEAEYMKVTYHLTLAVATSLARLNPQMTFIYISGEGADSSEKGNVMWARVRGKTENALFGLPFRAVYVFRPGIIRPLNGIESKTAMYRIIYHLTGPLLPALRWAFPKLITTTERLGRAMIGVAKNGAHQKILKPADFEKIA